MSSKLESLSSCHGLLPPGADRANLVLSLGGEEGALSPPRPCSPSVTKDESNQLGRKANR